MMGKREVTRKQFLNKSLLAGLGVGSLALLFGSSSGGIGSESDPLAVLVNPASPQTVISGNPLTMTDLGSAGVGALRLVSPNGSHQIFFLSNDNDHLQIRMKIDQNLAPTGILSFLNFSLVDNSYAANCVAFDPFNLAQLGGNTLIIGDDSSLLPQTVPKIAFFTDPTGLLDFSHLGSGGMTPLLNGIGVGLPTAPAAVAGKPVGAGHGHNFSGQFQVGAYLENNVVIAPPFKIARWKNITTPITARRLSVLAQIAPAGGNDTFELTDLTTTLQVTLNAGATEAESPALTTRNFAANSILYFRLAASTAVTQSQKINLIADYTMNG